MKNSMVCWFQHRFFVKKFCLSDHWSNCEKVRNPSLRPEGSTTGLNIPSKENCVLKFLVKNSTIYHFALKFSIELFVVGIIFVSSNACKSYAHFRRSRKCKPPYQDGSTGPYKSRTQDSWRLHLFDDRAWILKFDQNLKFHEKTSKSSTQGAILMFFHEMFSFLINLHSHSAQSICCRRTNFESSHHRANTSSRPSKDFWRKAHEKREIWNQIWCFFTKID